MLLNEKPDAKIDVDPYKIKTWDSEAIFEDSLNLKFASVANIEKSTNLKNSNELHDAKDVKVLFAR